jgi:hypothetical protein
MQNLPTDIIYSKIIPYTYNVQPSFILTDIKNFFETKQIISNIYYIRNSHLLEFEENADKYWLISDILLFIKRHKQSSFTKINKSYNKFICSNKSVHNQFNIYWSTLTPAERDNFILLIK